MLGTSELSVEQMAIALPSRQRCVTTPIPMWLHASTALQQKGDLDSGLEGSGALVSHCLACKGGSGARRKSKAASRRVGPSDRLWVELWAVWTNAAGSTDTSDATSPPTHGSSSSSRDRHALVLLL